MTPAQDELDRTQFMQGRNSNRIIKQTKLTTQPRNENSKFPSREKSPGGGFTPGKNDR